MLLVVLLHIAISATPISVNIVRTSANLAVVVTELFVNRVPTLVHVQTVSRPYARIVLKEKG